MIGDRWKRVEELYHAALPLTAEARSALLAQATAGDEDLRREVETLLASAESSGLLDESLGIAPALTESDGHSTLTGRQIGVYAVRERIGAGGMGEVYRARDTKLGRDVAIKILPTIFTRDRERLSRFEREARVLASLNHPRIGAIYGLESLDGTPALVLELVDGDTLAERIAGKPLPVSEALAIAAQIAEALEAAHDRGIVHRDLKPANIKITPAGGVKVLDFGLAKAGAGDASSPDLSKSPTVGISGTRDDVILGTAAYMSPEQATGKQVDRRTDIWAFGCVLYEMLTGRQPFAGDGLAETLAFVLTKDPDWSALPRQLPSAIRTLLRRCLERERQKRVGDVAAIHFALGHVAGLSIDPQPVDVGRSDVRRKAATRRWAALLVVTAIVAGLGTWYFVRQRPSTLQTLVKATRMTIVPEGTLQLGGDSAFALSPNGRRLAYAAKRDGRRQAYLQEVDQFDAKPISGTEGAISVAFSPDGNWLAFSTEQQMHKVPVAGGVPVSLAGDFSFGIGERGDSLNWESNDSILFDAGPSIGIWRIPAAGGTPSRVTALGPAELEHHYPQILPGGKSILYSAVLNGDYGSHVVVQSLDTGQRRVITTGAAARYFPPGYLVYVQAGTVFAAPFDLARLEITGAPTVALQGVHVTPNGVPQIAYSQSGSMAYLPTTGNAGLDTLVWVDRSGAEQPTNVSGNALRAPRLAPDLRRVSVALSDAVAFERNQSDVWVYDIMRGAPSRVTFDGSSMYGVWSPDGTRLAYNSGQVGRGDEIHLKTIGGPGPDRRLSTSQDTNFPFSWSPDGRFLAAVLVNSTGNHVWVYDVDGTAKSRALTGSEFREGAPTFSHDGRWVAYTALKSGRSEIYMSPFPGPGEEFTISTDGGNEPQWARKTGQLFYRRGDAMMEVDISTTPTPVIGKPRKLFEGTYKRSTAFWPNYDVTPDGQRFLMIKGSPQKPATRINVVQNWVEELKGLTDLSR